MGDDLNTILSGANAPYVAGLYARYSNNPNSVPSDWVDLFRSLNDDQKAVLAELNGPSWTPKREALPDDYAPSAPKDKGKGKSEGLSAETLRDALNAQNLINAYRAYGHYLAATDPLGLTEPPGHPELALEAHGFSDADLDREVPVMEWGLQKAVLRDIVSTLQSLYCHTAGIEYNHIDNDEERAWLQEQIESGALQAPLSVPEQDQVLRDLTAAEDLELFLGKKFVGTKRFGLDGGESTIAALEEVVRRGADLGLRDIVFGMAHRGRLNVLTNVIQKPYVALFSEFQGVAAQPEDVQGSGDVKYHMGASCDRQVNGNAVHLSLAANPSHLETVNTIVVGKVRAKQMQLQDEDRSKVIGLLIHGDAAMAGQGLVMETFLLSQLKGYKTGGTLHLVINNQVGFTTNPEATRSGPYSTDIAKMVMAPVFHVNGDDAETVVRVARMAIEYRQRFKKDVVIDLICYRRFGHNESDEPAFTQPIMYKEIHGHESVCSLYAAKLVESGALNAETVDAIKAEFNDRLEQAFNASKNYKPNKADWLEGQWSGLTSAANAKKDVNGKTAIADDQAQRIGAALTHVPDDFNLNSKIARQLKAKADMFKTGQGFDWATAEALAFGSLLDEGTLVRLSGQDVGRGTFSHRHAVLRDQNNETDYLPLRHISDKQAVFEIYDSPLSEAGVLGFEYGYTLAEPNALVMWEAQFGDFVNGAQVIIDQYIASAETKWLRLSGLVMLLPHGFEGQGPEHSSARLERFLQACAEDNIQVANCSTPANYFHILRRQVRRPFRKPLVLMTPKSLLRHKLCVSNLSMMTGKSQFQPVLADDKLLDVKNVRRVVLCTGKVYYDLFEARETQNVTDVALVRVEQLYPFPAAELAAELKKYPKAQIVWAQEEPENMGAWQFVDRRIEAVLKDIQHSHQRPLYIGRIAAASPATGSLKRHNEEQGDLISAALKVDAALGAEAKQAQKRAAAHNDG